MSVSLSYGYAGIAWQTYTIPNGIYSIEIYMNGAGSYNNTAYGAGRVTGTASVSPGQVLYMIVGIQGGSASGANGGGGGWPAGGNGGNGYRYTGGYGGGGYSCVRVGGPGGTLLAVAGGAGGNSGDGGWGGQGGNGSGSRGGAGGGSTTPARPGLTNSAGGAGGTSSSGSVFNGGAGANGLGAGGNGGSTGGYDGHGGGGGGGGYGSGGGGCASSNGFAPGGGGGGGSEYWGGLANPADAVGQGGTGHGFITLIHADPNVAPNNPTSLTPAEGTATMSTGNLNATGVVSDPDGNQCRLLFRVTTDVSFASYTDFYSGWVNNGGVATVGVSGLAQNTRYYYIGYTQDPSGLYSSGVGAYSFWTNRTPLAPTLGGVADGGTFVSTSTPTFSWTFNDPDSAAGDVQSYAYLYYRKSTAPADQYTTVSITGQTASWTAPAGTFEPANTYVWWVATRDQGLLWGPNSSTRTFSVTGPANAPALTNPANDGILDIRNAINFQWTFSDPDAGDTQSKADFRYREVGATTWIETLTAVTGAGTTYTVAANTFAKNKYYEWQVRTYDAASNQGPYSQSRTFKARGLPDPVTNVLPADTTTQNSSTPTLSADRPAGVAAWTASYIEWQIASNTGFSTNLHTIAQPSANASATAGTVTQPVDLANRLAQGTWYLRARQVDPFGVQSAWTATTFFTISHKPTVGNLSPSSSVYLATSTATRFLWTFGDTSTSDAQTAFQVIIERNDTGASVVDSGKVVSANQFYDRNTTTYPKDVVLRWKVRVWDTDDIVSDYSPLQLFLLGDPPALTMTPINNSIVTSGNPTVAWTEVLGGTRVQRKWIVTFARLSDATIISTASGTDAATRNYIPPVTILRNAEDYSITLYVEDTSGLSSTITSNIHVQYDSPNIVNYRVDSDNVETLGYVLIDWSAMVPDLKFTAWHVYRREFGQSTWTLLDEITTQNTVEYHDWLFNPGTQYQWSVTQVADRSGVLLESPVGYYARPTALRMNYAVNPSFELDASSWSADYGTSGAGTFARVQAASASGSYLGRETWTTASTAKSGGPIYQTAAATVAPSDTVSVGLSVRCSKAQTFILRIRFRNAANAVLSTVQSSPVAATSVGSWQILSLANQIAPASTDHITVEVSVDTAGSLWAVNDYIDVDALIIEKVAQAGFFFDGNTAGAHWNGTINLSTSYQDTLIYTENAWRLPVTSHYWLIDENDELVSLLIPNVTNADLTDEFEEAVYTLIGRGRKKDSGTRLGYSGTLSASFRGYDGVPHLKRKQLELMRLNESNYWLRTPFGDLFQVSLGNITYSPIAGTATNEMLNVSIPFQEVS